MINSGGIDILSLYQKVKYEYENIIKEYSYTCNILNDMECVYVVEDSFIVYVGIIDFEKEENPNYYYIVINELLDNSIFKFNFSGFLRRFTTDEGFCIKCKRFHGLWAEPIRDVSELNYGIETGTLSPDSVINYQVDSKAEYVEKALPEIKLKERFNKWEGYLYYFIVYELIEDNHKGYAICHTVNPQVHKIARENANSVEWGALEYYAWLSNYRPEVLEKDMIFSYKHPQQWRGCNEDMINIMVRRIHKYKQEGWEHKKKKNVPSKTLCIAEHDLKYFWVSRYIKGSILADILKVQDEIFVNVQEGKYSELPRYEYLIPENKWKSEQLVYEITKKLYKKKTVLYQHRPFFLKTDKGQMSYDIFICGLNVAIEYQGKQHFEPVEIFGGEEHYKAQVERDKLKYRLSQENGVTLEYVNYWDDISPELIKERITEGLEKRGNQQ